MIQCCTYVFHVSYPAGVDANDVLYGSDPAFIADCNGLASSVLSAAIKSVQVNTTTTYRVTHCSFTVYTVTHLVGNNLPLN